MLLFFLTSNAKVLVSVIQIKIFVKTFIIIQIASNHFTSLEECVKIFLCFCSAYVNGNIYAECGTNYSRTAKA